MMPMTLRKAVCFTRSTRAHNRLLRRCCYHVLAIETSCDDTCVAILDRQPAKPPVILFQSRQSLKAVIQDGGVIPTKAHIEHQVRLATAVKHALEFCGSPKIDLVCATRGPGMTGCLAVGYELAKGLSVAWGAPLVGVHHMLGHLLVARLASSQGRAPQFPFLSLLVSGGHTILVHSVSVTQHRILADTIDIAAGDAIDKCGRHLGVQGQMIGLELERLALLGPSNKELALQNEPLHLPNPLISTQRKQFPAKFSYSPFISSLQQNDINHYGGKMASLPLERKSVLAYMIQKAIFHHTIWRVKIVLENESSSIRDVTDFVCSGGVASSSILRSMLSENLDFELHYPEPRLCTDNAVMIGSAGIELYELGYSTALDSTCMRKWPLAGFTENVDGWISR